MANLGYQMSTILNVESSRAFPNLFEVSIENISNIELLASKVSFEDVYGLQVDFNEAIQNNTITKSTRIKGMSITFKETAQYFILTKLKTEWLDTIYDFDNHYFKSFTSNTSPLRTITISLNDSINTWYYHIQDAIIKSIKYPSYSWSEATPIEIEANFAVGNVVFDTRES